MERLIGIQYLRGISALCVLTIHLVPRLDGGWSDSEFKLRFLSVGTAALLTVTGYFIWVTTSKPEASPGRWLLSRALRLLPLYWLCLTIKAAIDTVAGHPPGWGRFFAAYVFIPTINPDVGEYQPYFSPGWTIEMLVGFLLLAAMSMYLRRPWQRLGFLSGAYVLLLVLRQVGDLGHTPLVWVTSPQLSYFLGGVAVACYAARVPRSARVEAVGWISLAAGALFLALVSPRLFPGARSVCFGVPALLFVFGVVNLEDRIRPLGDIAPLRRIGDASYSIYLSHPLLVYPVGGLMNRLGIGPWPVAYLIAAPIIVAAGMLVYRCIEQPLAARIGRPSSRPARPLGQPV